MAYITQEQKKAMQPKIKEINKKYGIKATLGIRHHSTIVLRISSGKIDFIKNYNETSRNDRIVDTYIDVNTYYYKDSFSGDALEYLKEVNEVLNTDNYDNSDSQTDYFNVGHYVDIKVGNWEKPYEFTAV